MQTISQQLEEMRESIRRIEVTDDDVATWKDSKVTRRFLGEMKHAQLLLVEEDDDGPDSSVDRVALRATYIKAMRQTFDMILGWEPEDLEF